jgi:hypothetical protein
MSVRIIIKIEDEENGYQKIDAKSIHDDSSTYREKITAGFIHEVLTKELNNEPLAYFEQKKVKL